MGRRHRGVRHVAADLATAVLVCRKCGRKLDGGFGADGTERLARTLRRAVAAREGRAKALRASTAVMEVGCLDLCPKGAVVVLRADRPRDWVLVPPGTAAEEVLAHLDLGPPPAGGEVRCRS